MFVTPKENVLRNILSATTVKKPSGFFGLGVVLANAVETTNSQRLKQNSQRCTDDKQGHFFLFIISYDAKLDSRWQFKSVSSWAKLSTHLER
jgi:hypothetical protein